MAEAVKVIGGGFSGMAAAYYLAKNGFAVTLIEEKDRLGGIISTVRTSWGRAETAASGIMNSPLVEEFFSELQIAPAPRSRFVKKKYIYRDGRLCRWPLSGGETFRLAQGALGLIAGKKRPMAEESIVHWAARVIGPAAGEFLLSPALQGIYAGDPRQLSSSLILDKFFSREKESGGKKLQWGRGTLTPSNGMQELIDRLAAQLEKLGVNIQRNAPVQLQKGEKTVIAVPADRAADLVRESLPEIADVLAAVEYLPLASVTLFHPREEALRGFGVLFPEREKFNSLGVLLTDGLFIQDGEFAAERWILGGALHRDIGRMSEDEIRRLAEEDSVRLHGRPLKISGCHVQKWQRAIPHYSLRLERSLQKLPMTGDWVFFGNYSGSIGLKQILHSAEKLARQWRRAAG